MRSGLYKLCVLLFASIILLSHITNIASKTLVEPTTGDKIIDLLDKIGDTLNENRAYVADIIQDDAYQITTPGSYILTKDIQGPLTIASSDVWLNLNNYRVYDNTGTMAAIVVEDGVYDNITIYNGSVQGNNSPSGVLIKEGASLVKLDNLTITDCDIGILFDGTSTGMIKACMVKNCNLFYNTKGIVGHYLIKTIFEQCTAKNCFEVGFELENSNYNIFYKCKALEIENNELDTYAIGFSSAAGTANIFQGCVVEGITKNISDTSDNAIGFLLTGDAESQETKTEIVNCIGNVIENVINPNAYGILLQASLVSTNPDFLYFLDSYNYKSDIMQDSIRWHPTGDFLAVAGVSLLFNFKPVQILEFDLGTQTLSAIPTATYQYSKTKNVYTVGWHPAGRFLAIGGQTDNDPEVRILEFDSIAQTLTLIPTATYTYGDDVISVDWHYTGSFLAIGGYINNPEVRILSFDADTQTLTLIPTATYEYGEDIFVVDWHPTGSFLAIGGRGAIPEVRILAFDSDAQTLSIIPTATYAYGGQDFSLDWHPTGSFFAIGGSGDSPEVRILAFDANTQTLSAIPTATYEYGSWIFGVSWHPTGNFLAIGGQANNPEVRILAFDPENQTLLPISTATYGYGYDVNAIDWSIDSILVIGGFGNPPIEVEIPIFSFLKKPQSPINCTIKKNEIANCSGTAISGDGNTNLISKNISYNNATDYVGVGNTQSIFATPPINPYFNFFY